MTQPTLRSLAVLVLSFSFVACSKKEPEAAPPPPPAPAAKAPPAHQTLPPVPAPADVAAPPADAQKFPNGIAMKIEKPGTSTEKPADYDMVRANFVVWTTDGKMFDRKDGATFPLSNIGMPKGWAFALEQMNPGETALVWIPAELAFKGRPGPQGTNVVRFEVVSIQKGQPPIPAPADVAAPPADAEKTPSGLAIKVLKPGTGKVHPKPSDTISVTYTGWTTDGKMFDSSRGRPVTFPLGHLIPGWVEGIQHMVEGESARMWIPGALAYKNNPRGPQGQLCFDIDLIKVAPTPAGGPPGFGPGGMHPQGLPPGMHLNMAPHPGSAPPPSSQQ